MRHVTGPADPTSRRPGRARAVVALVLLVVAETAAVTLLVSLGRRPPFDLPLAVHAWAEAEPADALAAALRWVALGAAAWLLAATLASVVWGLAGLRGARPPHVRIARVVPRTLRLLAEQALVGGLALGVASVPAAAQVTSRQDPPVVTVVRDGRATDLASLPGVETTATTPAPAPAPAPTVTIASPTPITSIPGAAFADAGPSATAPVPDGLERTVVVAPGEHLWELAAREVARVRGAARDAVSDTDIAPYWITVCDANRSRLASRDVNLVFVGETVVLPPVG